jgi:hypothetical protein
MNQELIDRYVAGKMSEPEAVAFEDYCVANPEFAKQVEFEQRLKNGLRIVASGSTAEFVRSAPPERWKVAIAASLVLCVLAGAFFWQRLPGVRGHILASVPAESQQQFASMRLALIRGAESLPNLPAGLVRVEIVGLFDPGFHYNIALDRLDEHEGIATVATLYGQHPTSPVTLEILIDSAQLERGSYFLRVRKQASDDEALDFSFVKS